MSTEKLSTGFELSTALLKKREGEKRHSPLNPYREKGKGKEINPVLAAQVYSRAHTRTRTCEALSCVGTSTRRSFSHALKKVKDFLYACKQRTKSMSES